MPTGVYIRTEEMRRNIGEGHKGLFQSPEKKRKISIALKGRKNPKGSLAKLGSKNPMFGKKAWNKGLKLPQLSNENHPNWKGNNASYGSIHDWIDRYLG